MFDFIVLHWDEILGAITGVIAAASAIAALTPTPADDSVVAMARKVVDLLALNVGGAKSEASAKK